MTMEADLLTNNGNQTDPEELKTSDPFCNVSIVSVGMSSAKQFVLLIMSAYVLVYVTMAIAKKKQKGYRG